MKEFDVSGWSRREIYEFYQFRECLGVFLSLHLTLLIVFCMFEISQDDFTFKGGEKVPEKEQIYFSCLPWMEITSLSSERVIDADDAVPRIAWGKYVRRDGRLQLCVSVDVNHRLIDGYYIAPPVAAEIFGKMKAREHHASPSSSLIWLWIGQASPS